jgi:hypothetical protein
MEGLTRDFSNSPDVNYKAILLAFLFCSTLPAVANVAIVRVSGGTLRLLQSDSIEMLSEDIDIRPLGNERLGVVEYHCHFVLHNSSDEAVTFQAGFPLDGPTSPDQEGRARLAKNFAFEAKDARANYTVTLVKAPEAQRREYQQMFLWDMEMNPDERRDLWVNYRLGISIRPMGLRQSNDQVFPVLNKISRIDSAGTLGWGYAFAYTTSSGATWKGGRIGQAKFTLHDKEFRAAMDALQELPALGTRSEIAEDIGAYCFAGALPGSRIQTEDGFRWQFENFLPGPRIEYEYGFCGIPTNPKELAVLSDLSLAELRQARQLLVAAYGGAPQDPALVEKLRNEFWYRPDPNFTEDALPSERKAVLAEPDKQIARRVP